MTTTAMIRIMKSMMLSLLLFIAFLAFKNKEKKFGAMILAVVTYFLMEIIRIELQILAIPIQFRGGM